MNPKAVLGSLLKKMSFCPYLSYKNLDTVSLEKSYVSFLQVSTNGFYFLF